MRKTEDFQAMQKKGEVPEVAGKFNAIIDRFSIDSIIDFIELLQYLVIGNPSKLKRTPFQKNSQKRKKRMLKTKVSSYNQTRSWLFEHEV